MNRYQGHFLLHAASLLSTCFAFICFLPGCQHDTTTVFPPGLEPVATDSVAPPNADGGDSYPETLSLVQGSTSDYNYVFATGYVDASIEDVWAAFKMPNVVVDRHAITSYTVTPNVETGYDVSFLTAYTIDSIVTVSYDLTWREGVVAGTEADPSQVSVVYQKTSGSSFVSLMDGSIQLNSVSATVTELQFAQRMNAMDTDSSNIASWTNEIFSSVVAQVHGKSLP
jgi:hypothetical protein